MVGSPSPRGVTRLRIVFRDWNGLLHTVFSANGVRHFLEFMNFPELVPPSTGVPAAASLAPSHPTVLRCLLIALALMSLVASRQATAQSHPASSDLVFDEAARAASELPRLHSLLISHRGTLVLERYFNGTRASRPANVKSVSKSVISALVGIAIDRGHIGSVREPIGEYFNDLLRDPSDASKRAITIEDLLTMRSGLESTSSRNYGAWVNSRHWVRYVLSRPLLDTPGSSMEYSTGNTHLLSAILAKATGKSTWQFAQEVLAKPLGFSLARWPQDPQGIYFGGNEMVMTSRQMVAFGELYLNRGRVGGRQVVPESWVDDSFVRRGKSDYSEQMYGYGWWIRQLAGQQAFYAWGFGGQYIFVVPAAELVVVTTSSTATGEERRSHRRTIFDLVEQFVVAPALRAIQTSAGVASAAESRTSMTCRTGM
jgi:CubicO group peptidase (beta-lactamase class C family)